MVTIRELIAAGQVRARTSGDVAVTNSAGGTKLLSHNPMRVQVVVVDNEANAAHVTRRPNPTTTTGRRLDASGGGFVDLYERMGRAIGGEYWAILETAAGNLYVEEYEAYLLPGQEVTG